MSFVIKLSWYPSAPEQAIDGEPEASQPSPLGSVLVFVFVLDTNVDFDLNLELDTTVDA